MARQAKLKKFTPAHHIRMRHRLGISWTKSKILFNQIKYVVHSSQMAVSNWKDVVVAMDAYMLPTIEKVTPTPNVRPSHAHYQHVKNCWRSMIGGTTTWVDVKNKVAPWVEPASV